MKFLILDGISGVPLGREITQALQAEACTVNRFDCLEQQVRRFHGLRSAYAKLVNKQGNQDSFYALPKLSMARLATLIAQETPTHILVVGFIYKFFDPQILRRLADTCQAQLLLYDTDSCNLYDKRREFIFFIENELPIYDRIFSFSQVTTNFFKETRALPAVHLPYGAHPIILPEQQEHTIDALFVGSCDLRRVFLLEAVREKVSIFGNRWRRNFPLISPELQTRVTDTPVWGKDLHFLLARTKIVLNITRSEFYGAETGVNLRIFETLAAGCFLLTDYCEELKDLFIIGEEIETFSSSAELAEKVHYYLNNETARQTIAKRGHAVFMHRHTWQTRIRQMLLQTEDDISDKTGKEKR